MGCLPGKTLSRQRGQACAPANEKDSFVACEISSGVQILNYDSATATILTTQLGVFIFV